MACFRAQEIVHNFEGTAVADRYLQRPTGRPELFLAGIRHAAPRFVDLVQLQATL